jgi:DNA polymerase elongation subunit (family B)
VYQNIYYNRKDKNVYVWDDNEGMKFYPLSSFRYAYKRKVGGKYRSLYNDELEKVINFDEKDPNLFESDVPVETRALIDLYGDSDEISTNHTILTIDIEVDSENGFPKVLEGDKKITAISLHDNISNKYCCFVLDTENKIDVNDLDIENTIVKSFDNEEDMLLSFLNKYEEIQPTICTGWHCAGFDFPYLFSRIKEVLGATEVKRLSPVGVCYINKFREELMIAGVSILDYLNLYKRYSGIKLPTYKLGAVSKKEIGKEKIVYEGSLNNLYNTDIKKYIEYNLNDVYLVVELHNKLNFIDLARTICHIGHVPYEQFEISTKILEGAMLSYMRRNDNLVSPNKSLTGKEEYEKQIEDGIEGFEGAYVKEPECGFYEWIYDLDLSSMYPSTMISLNISPETKIGRIDNWNVEEYLKGSLKEIIIGSVKYSIEEFQDEFISKNFSIASNGVIYRNDKPGIIPSILTQWFNNRKELRKKEKEYSQKGDKENASFYYRRQQAIKILLNSLYGVLGAQIFRFYDKDDASAVTLTGQDIIKTTEKCINQYYKRIIGKSGSFVVYVDTDATFVSALPLIRYKYPNIDESDDIQMSKAILEVASEVQKHVNLFYNIMAKKMFNVDKHCFEIKQEVISKIVLWLGKKRYIQKMINKGGVPTDEYDFKGVDVVRSSFPVKFKEFLEQFLKDVLNKKPKAELDDNILKFKENMKSFNISDIAKSTSVKFVSLIADKNYNPENRKPFQIITGSPAQVKASLYYNDLLELFGLDKKVEKIFSNQKIVWLYIKENPYGIDCIALKNDGTDPKEILDFVEKYIDRNTMFDQELKSKITNNKKNGVYDILKWNFPDETSKVAGQFFDF